MKKQLTYLAIITLVSLSCSNLKDNKTTTQTAAKDSSDFFLDLFVDINPDNLHIYSPCGKTDGNKFGGKLIDRQFYNFFKFNKDNKEFIENISQDSNLYHLFNCYKFPLTADRLGLLVRIPSQYTESAICLYIWDNKNKKIIGAQTMTDGYGDEGWYFVRDAWLKDVNKDNQIDIITRQKDSNQDIDDTINPPTISDNLLVYLFNGQEYKQTKFNVDTNQFQILDW